MASLPEETMPKDALSLDAAALLDLLPPSDDAAWFPGVRETLARSWRSGRKSPDEPRICALANAVASGKGHISLPCSIADDDQAIERFLVAKSMDADPIAFARLFMFLLDDFVESLSTCYSFLGEKRRPRAPALVGTWANHFAKHRQNFAILHHPKYLFLDHPRAVPWERAARKAPTVTVIDTAWFDGRKGLPNPERVRANDQPAIVVVPRLLDFLGAAKGYYDEFVRHAADRRDQLRRFETPNHDLGFEMLLERLRPHIAEGDDIE